MGYGARPQLREGSKPFPTYGQDQTQDPRGWAICTKHWDHYTKVVLCRKLADVCATHVASCRCSPNFLPFKGTVHQFNKLVLYDVFFTAE